jgi:hypothetical protein
MLLWDLLWKYMDHGLASQGATGELISRGLGIYATDRAFKKLPPASIRELKYQTPVAVTDYYKALLTDDTWEELRQSIPANRAWLSEASANTTFVQRVLPVLASDEETIRVWICRTDAHYILWYRYSHQGASSVATVVQLSTVSTSYKEKRRKVRH